MSIFQPLIDQADAVTREANQLHDSIKQCQDFIDKVQPQACPKCQEADNVRLIYAPPTIKVLNAHGIAIHCFSCGIQTAPQYWHLSEPVTSPYSALYDAYEAWGFTEKKKEQA
ncbi:hypothetical protein [Methylophaga sp. OBS4]|uniref:hypothetical protein n=1 Tax=Methylophaga sp. OBS4 TaxID=2991935 RepID=UPI0022567575|nr:hypothetical protein [Methylophaga sp. OBS4]MCX4186740.1 hypothetical protein [Methylophaga sp. OBS4]